MVTPAPPPVPTQWNAHNIIAYVAGLAVFVLGTLTASGVVFPASGTVKIVVGIVAAIAGSLITQVPLMARASIQKTALKSGVSPAEAQLL